MAETRNIEYQANEVGYQWADKIETFLGVIWLVILTYHRVGLVQVRLGEAGYGSGLVWVSGVQMSAQISQDVPQI